MQVKHSNTSVVTYIEVALFIIIASSILILVYPKQSILELLQKETGNGELAAAYLRNIANQYPNDKQAWAALVTQYMKTGRIYDAEEMIAEMKKLDESISSEFVPKLRYSIAKYRLFSTDKGTYENTRAMAEARNVLKEIIASETNITQLEILYKEALQLTAHSVAILASDKLSEIDKENRVKWIKQSYKLSLELSSHEEAVNYLRTLSQEDHDERIKWLEELYKLSLATSSYENAKGYAGTLSVENIGKRINWLEELYRLSLATSDYKDAITYLETLSNEDRPKRLGWLQELHVISLQTSDLRAAIQYAEILANEDKISRLAWLEKAFQVSLAVPDTELAKKYAEIISKEDPANRLSWLVRLAQFAMGDGNYTMASQYYLDAMEASSQPERKQFFLNSLQTLQSGNLLKEATVLSEKYQDEYLKDDEMMSFLIKLHLAADDLEGAKKLSLKLTKDK